jgi:hypothetical protein
MKLRLISLVLCVCVAGCGSGTEADDLGVGAECAQSDDCLEGQACLAFKGGYCGVEGCEADDDCPEGSACVASEGVNYCFRVCLDKAECNANRSVEFESNCSANVTFVNTERRDKACVPPA